LRNTSPASEIRCLPRRTAKSYFNHEAEAVKGRKRTPLDGFGGRPQGSA
jgi:hypothetical protein